jgi:hypothetical protein
MTSTEIMWQVTSFSLQWHRFKSISVHVGFEMDKVVQGAGYL